MGHTHVPSVDGDGVRGKPLPVPSCSRVPPTGLQALWPEGQEAHAVLSESQAKPLCSNSFGIQRTAKYGALFGYHGNSLFMAAQALVRPVSTEGLPSRDQPTATEDRCVCVCVCACVCGASLTHCSSALRRHAHSFPRANQEEGQGKPFPVHACCQPSPRCDAPPLRPLRSLLHLTEVPPSGSSGSYITRLTSPASQECNSTPNHELHILPCDRGVSKRET